MGDIALLALTEVHSPVAGLVVGEAELGCAKDGSDAGLANML